MDDKTLKAYNAIVNFVEALAENFKYVKSIVAYDFLLSKTTLKHVQHIQKHVKLFEDFTLTYKNCIFGEEDFPQTALVSYSERAYIDIAYCVRKSEDVKAVIIQHLLTISAIIHPNEQILKKLEANLEDIDKLADPSTVEGAFIGDLMGTVKESFGNMEATSNPMEVVGNLLTGGGIQKVLGSFMQGMSNGQMDVGKLMGSMQTMMATMMHEAGGEDLSGGSEIPFDMSKMLSQLTETVSKTSTHSNNSPATTTTTTSTRIEIKGKVSNPPPQAESPKVVEIDSEPPLKPLSTLSKSAKKRAKANSKLLRDPSSEVKPNPSVSVVSEVKQPPRAPVEEAEESIDDV